MNEEQLNKQFDEWVKSYVAQDPKKNWNLINGHDSEDFYAFLGFEACAKIKDVEIEVLKKQLNAMVTSDVARNHLIEWKVSEGVKAKTKELESLSSERDANSILTQEIEALKAQVEKMRDALETCDKADSFGQINRIVSNVLNTTPESSLAEHDKEVGIKVLDELYDRAGDHGEYFETLKRILKERRK